MRKKIGRKNPGPKRPQPWNAGTRVHTDLIHVRVPAKLAKAYRRRGGGIWIRSLMEAALKAGHSVTVIGRTVTQAKARPGAK